MKLAIVIENFDLTAGGNERSTEQIVQRLVQRGHDVSILTNSVPDDLSITGCQIIKAQGPKTRSAIGLLRFRRWVNAQIHRGHYDVSLSMTTAVSADVIQPRGGTVRETLKQNIVMRHTAWKKQTKRLAVTFNLKQQALLWCEQRTFNSQKVKTIIAISQYVADQLHDHYDKINKQIELIPNAAAITLLTQTERAQLRNTMRDSLQLHDEHVAFLFAATNPRLKGLPQLLDAFENLLKTQPNARLIVAGSLCNTTQMDAIARNIGHAIRWVGPTSQMDALYCAADVTVLPTWYDPSSKVIIESLLHGIPAISTRFNGASQWITNPANLPDTNNETPTEAGHVIDSPDKIDQLTAAMLDLCDTTKRQACAKAALQLDQRLSMDQHVDALEKVLMDVSLM